MDYKASASSPELIDRDIWGILRYRAFIPLSDEGWQDITLGESMTPVIRFSENVLRKMDYRILEARAELAAKGVCYEHTTAATWVRLGTKGELRPNPLHAPLRA